MSDDKTEGNGHGGPTEEEKARVKENILKKFDEMQEAKKKDQGKDKK